MSLNLRAVELERQLAEAQGHEVAFVAPSGTIWIRKPDGNIDWLPRPARDVVDSMNLMLEVSVWPREVNVYGNQWFEVVDSGGRVCHREVVRDDDDRKALLLIAVVAGAIALFKMKKD